MENGGRMTVSKIKRFEDLEVWQESMRLAVDIYKLFKPCKDYGMRDQVQRSAVSIPSNISEGYDIGSNKEFIRFLNIARGSRAELRTQLYLSSKINIIPHTTAHEFIEHTHKISAMLFNLIKTRKEKF